MDEAERESDERFVAEFEALYAAAVRRYHRRIPADIAGGVTLSAIIFGLSIVLLKLVHASVDSYVPTMICLCAVVIRFKGAQAARRAANQTLESASDPRLIGVLARLIGSRAGSVRRSARIGLKSVLPLVRPRQAHLIDSEGMGNLLGLLAKPTGAELTIRLIRSLEHVGNERAIEPLQRLANPALWQSTTLLSSEDVRAVAECAAMYLPFIQQRAELARQSTTLLRPSSHRDESLLRSTVNVVTEPESQLLRAAHQLEDGCE